jgi:hypothetical protein
MALTNRLLNIKEVESEQQNTQRKKLPLPIFLILFSMDE